MSQCSGSGTRTRLALGLLGLSRIWGLPDALQKKTVYKRDEEPFGIFVHGPSQMLLRHCLFGPMSLIKETFVFFQCLYWRTVTNDSAQVYAPLGHAV